MAGKMVARIGNIAGAHPGKAANIVVRAGYIKTARERLPAACREKTVKAFILGSRL